MFGSQKRLERKLSEEGGVVAWATIVDAHTQWTSGSNYANDPYSIRSHHMKVKVRVEPDGEPPFEETFAQTLEPPVPMAGFQAKVIYDPADHSKILIQEGQVFPPGISHEQAERSADRRQRAVAAAESGNIAEFVEQEKAAALERAQQAQADFLSSAGLGAGAGASAPAAASTDIAGELKKLADLHSSGVLTDAEFAAAKAKLLNTL
jgi:hypothetical protein